MNTRVSRRNPCAHRRNFLADDIGQHLLTLEEVARAKGVSYQALRTNRWRCLRRQRLHGHTAPDEMRFLCISGTRQIVTTIAEFERVNTSVIQVAVRFNPLQETKADWLKRISFLFKKYRDPKHRRPR